jgi:phosphopantothenoylcysteine decarboxylase/phosphopantothenate--cysteine ligase
VKLITAEGVEPWPDLSKDDVAARLAGWIAERFT